MKLRSLIAALMVLLVSSIVFHFSRTNSQRDVVSIDDLGMADPHSVREISSAESPRDLVEGISSSWAKLPAGIPEEKSKNLKWPFLCGNYADDYDGLNEQEKLEKMEGDINAQNDERRLIATKLSHSDDAEHLLMSALYSVKSESSIDFDLLSKAAEKNSRHPMIVWHLLRACEPGSAEQVCANYDVEKHAIEVAGDNGEVWGRIALRRMRAGNGADAISAMRKANGVPNFSNYFIEHLQMFDRGLAASTNYSDIERVFGAMGFAVALTSSSSRVYRLCQEQSINSSEWRTECLQFGKRMDANNGTIIDSLIGLALQRQMYELDGDWSSVSDVLDREKYVESEHKKTLWTDTQTVIQSDPRVISEYIAHWAAHGELSALQYAARETERLKSIPGYNPCEFGATPAP